AFILDVRHRILTLSETLIMLAETLVNRAESDKNTPMPDYTYLQAAQPTTFGHYLLGFTYPVLRDLERLDCLLEKVNRSPMGCGSTNGSRLPQGREQLAELLGFAAIIPHARDAMWQADLTIENTALLTACIVNLSRLAEDLQIFSTQEFALVELDDQHARASKIMPQKKNPFALTHIRAIANKMIGLTASVCASARTPSGQPDNRLMIYGELPEGMRLVEQAAALMSETLQRLSFKSDRAYALIGSGWALATDLAEALVHDCDLDFRSAHQLVASLVREYPADSYLNMDADSVMRMSEKVLGKSISLSDAQLKSALTPEEAIQQRKEAGGTSSASLDAMLADCRQQLNVFREKTQVNKIFFEHKRQSLLQRSKSYIRT
ncbi:MAG: lyase family protein, partial [Methylosarcina sp.]